jgi:transposase-like protein
MFGDPPSGRILAMITKWTPSRMARLVVQWRRSGESQASFARRHHIPGWTFWYWCRKLSDQPETERDATPTVTFVPVRVAAEAPEPVLEIVLTSGERLQVRSGASADLVRAVVTALRAGC